MPTAAARVDLPAGTDRLTAAQRRKCMQANKSKGTKPERLLAKTLWHMGVRYRKNDKTVFGKPDLCFRRYRIAVFVDGEFWHGKDWAERQHDIKSNAGFWRAKIERNMARDREVDGCLVNAGWQVLRFWGKDVVKDPKLCALAVYEALQNAKAVS